jgi:hypothetical protein
MRYRLRTLLILLAVGPPLLCFGWTKCRAWRAERVERERRSQRIILMIGPTVDATNLPRTVGEYEDRLTTATYVGIEGAMSADPPTRRRPPR